MLGRTKGEKKSAYKGMALAVAILVLVPSTYVKISTTVAGLRSAS